MSVERPNFEPNIQANLANLTSEKIFVDPKPDATTIVRFLPPLEDGIIFHVALNHYNFKDQEGNNLAMACLERHGTEETGNVCYVDQVLEVAEGGDTYMRSLAANKGGHPARPRYYAQVAIGELQQNKTVTYIGPKLMGLAATAANGVIDILKNQQSMGEDIATSADVGQAIYIHRKGAGLQTRYSVERSGNKTKLDEIFPKWESKYIHDVYSKLRLKVYSPEMQKEIVRTTHGDKLDWDLLEKAGL